MTLFAKLTATLVLSLVASSGLAASQDTREEGASMTSQFYQGNVDALWERMTPQMQAALQSKKSLTALRGQVLAAGGEETDVVSETVSTDGGYDIYVRQARFAKSPAIIQITWAFDTQRKIAGFNIRPHQASPSPPAASERLGYKNRTPLQLPFSDEFYVFWGGRSVEQNYHAAHAGQRFAMDLLVLQDGSSHRGEGSRNEDYFCFGKPILAPADGRVVEVIDGVADNVPGEMNPSQPTGNRVVIDHGNDEYSVLAHLRQGSVRVTKGQVVRTGAQMADCGNSGNSSEAHLHYQLQAGPEFGKATALPAQFSNYLADDKPVALGEPVKGQRIRQATPAP